ncbi:MAG: ABC-F family ATP-binding cassette domain-containing protein [Clostridia bacterium]
MNLLTAENISKSYSEKILLSSISIGISEGDKVGVIGINGTGKSTLLKILAGIEQPDQGKITTSNGLNIEYLSQTPHFVEDATILQQVFKGNSPVMKLLREYEAALQEMNRLPNDASLQKKLVGLNQSMDALNGWRIESDAKTILTRLEIHDFNARIETLSGGQRKRVAMASALITSADLLILDEPTNHIDNETVDWLEEYLNNRKGALLMVTHDRYFLDRVANKIIELDRGNLYSYNGNYSLFLEKKIEREELERASERKRQNLLRNELAWIQRGAKARSTKQKARIERFEKLQSSETELVSDKIEISAGSSRLGRKVINLINICKRFGEKKLISDFTYTVLRDDRIGIIGPNGSGKSTFLKMLAGSIEPDDGKIDRGQTVKIALFSQESEGMDENLRVIEYLREVAEYIETPDGMISASQMLERFLFNPAVQWTPISKLSGGEKRRLYLLKILMDAPNILLLDEPTNDLDIQTLTILESYLDEFPGAVIAVSHDRYFLDRVADKIFAFEGRGNIRQIIGNYSDYLEHLERYIMEESKETTKSEETSDERENKKNRPLKLSYKEEKEYEQIDGVIADIEKNLSDLENEITAAASDYSLLEKLTLKQQQLEKQLEEAVDRWAYLNELVEQVERAQRESRH